MAKQKTPTKKPSQKPDDQDDQDGAEDKDEDDDNEDDAEAENRRINAIVTSRVKREMKGVLAQLAQLTEVVTKQNAKKSEDEETDEDGEGDQGDKSKRQAETDPKLARKLAKMEKELADEKDARKKAELAQKDEAEKARRQELVSVFDAALTEHGISDPILRKAALRHLEDEGKMVRDEESGKPRFKGQDKYGIETAYEPKVGLKAWVLTEGKSFVPAVDAGGSGTGASRTGAGNSNITKGEFSKLNAAQKASIDLERACQGLPPLE